VADPVQRQSAKQGLDESVVTMVRDSTPKTKEFMRRALDVVDRSKQDARYAAQNRPGDIVGESLANRTRVLRGAADTAGKMIDTVAKRLKGQEVDVQPAIQGFLDDIDSLGIEFNPKTGALKFEGSDIEGLSGPENIVSRMVNRLYNSGKAPDAYDVHRMKRFIDEQVAYGKAGEGLTGRAVNVMKSLRHNLDGILDQNFQDYNRVNTQYSEAINALTMLQDVAGKRIDLTGEYAETALGTLSRRILGNPVSRQQLLTAVDEIDRVAKKALSDEWAGQAIIPYRRGAVPLPKPKHNLTLDDLDDDIVAQVRFVSDLEGIFGTNAKNSFFGEIDKATDRAMQSAITGDKTGPIREGVGAAMRAARGINEENALKRFRELLRD
jgi:hypothetical protein